MKLQWIEVPNVQKKYALLELNVLNVLFDGLGLGFRVLSNELNHEKVLRPFLLALATVSNEIHS